MKTWVKVYTEINRDPDIGTLTWAQRGIWTALLALAGEIDDRDEDEQETGILDTIDRVAWSIRCDLAELREAVTEFVERGMVEVWNDDELLVLPNYPKRQGRPPSSRPSAVAERVKRHRAKVQVECNDVTDSMKRGVTPSEADTESDAESESESDIDAESESAEPVAAAVADALKSIKMGQITTVIKEAAKAGLTAEQVIDTCEWAKEEGKDAALVRSMFRLGESNRPRAPDDGRKRYMNQKSIPICEKCYQHPCACEDV